MRSSPAAGARDEVVAGLAVVSAQYARMADLPVFALADAVLGRRTAAAARALRSAQEMVARLAGEADRAGVAERAGATSTRAWLIGGGMSPRDASRAVAQGRAMTPATEPTRLAWARGEVCGDRAEAVAAAVADLPDTADRRLVDAAQRDLVARARSLTVREVRRQARRMVDLVDPARADRLRADLLASQEQRAYDTATLRIRKGLDGTARFSGTMPNLTADMLTANLDAIAAPRRDHLRDHQPDDGRPEEHVPHEARMGRALCELVEKTRPSDLPADGVNATVVVTVDEQALRQMAGTATLSSGDEVSVSEARRLACGAATLPAVLGGASAPLDLGQASRLFDRRQRLALAIRDGGCVFPGCDRPPGWTEAHHVTPWSEGGPTDLANGALLCGHHHRLVHRQEADPDDGWQIHIAPDGTPETTPPRRVDPERRPIRHQRPRRRRRQAA